MWHCELLLLLLRGWWRAGVDSAPPPPLTLTLPAQEVHDAEDQAAVLQSLSNCLGAEVWCNTVVAFTHAADVAAEAAPSSGGPPAWQAATKRREHTLQLMIRRVSGGPLVLGGCSATPHALTRSALGGMAGGVSTRWIGSATSRSVPHMQRASRGSPGGRYHHPAPCQARR
jgi:hypothetical protein